MSRVSKYRVFNTIDKVMIDKPNSPRSIDGVLTCDEDDILIQFTGLADKNGVEIYESDIVVEDGYVGVHVVKNTELAGYYPFEYCGGGEVQVEDCRVIGNVHQHPELLS